MILNLHTSELLHNLESGAAITVFLALIVLLGNILSLYIKQNDGDQEGRVS